MHTEYMPEPPMPWNARKTMLIDVRANEYGQAHNSQLRSILGCPTSPREYDKGDDRSDDCELSAEDIAQFRPDDKKT